MRRILITGAAGFIGTNFVYYWLNKHPYDYVVALDALTYAGKKENMDQALKNKNFEFIHGSILDQALIDSLMQTRGINTIVHFAAESHVDRSIAGPDEFIETNIVGTHKLLKAAKKYWLDMTPQPHRFHHVSTDEVYGTLKFDDPPFSEKTPYAPNSPYAASKAASDHLVRAYHKTYGLQTTISNCSNNYGPYQFPEKLIPLIINNILNNISLPVYGDGLQIRDWLYVDDHTRGIDLILQSAYPGETYNIGANNEQANLNLIKLICEKIHEKFSADKELQKNYPLCPSSKGVHPETLISHIEDRPGHDRRYAVNADKISKELDYIPEESFESGLEKTINWFLHQKNNAK